ncbi:MAG: DNA adenine methylase, partial [Candidatus Asgardarchaeia archaeon]
MENEETLKVRPKPFVKWAGGKGQLLNIISENIPTSFEDYYEPFVGGGAVFFYLYSNGLIRKAYLSDLNEDLINAYNVIKYRVYELIEELKNRDFYANKKEQYYKIREWEPKDPIKKAARFIYLNKTAYNGLYRVNSKGKFNVPFGRYKNPKILDEVNLLAVHEALQVAEIFVADFQDAVKTAKKGDFIYFDPPYQPVSSTARFTQYTKGAFKKEDQIRLARVFKELDSRGCFILLSNSNNYFIKTLYNNYRIITVHAKRAINSK